MITPDRLTRNSAEPPNRGNYYQHNYIKLVGNVNRNRKFSQKTSLHPLTSRGWPGVACLVEIEKSSPINKKNE